MKYFLIAPFVFLILEAAGQKSFQFGSSLPVSILDRSLPMPFAGGINSAQIQQMDINGNGQEELVVWDRNAGNLLVFEKMGGEYIHNPILSYYFPEDINGFILLADFDRDGRKDLFTSSPFGIKAYKNLTGSTARFPQWEVEQDFLRLDNNSNLQVNSLDIPAIMDIDGDGDLDIVTFNFASGDFLEYYQNTSVERSGISDIDGFASAVSRWGGFEFCSCGNFAFGQTCSGSPLLNTGPNTESLKVEHAGGHSILLHDFNEDGNLDILMGQDECSSLYFLANEGSNSAPDFNAFSRDLPLLSPLPEFPIFHGAYIVDQDLVITTNSSHSSSQNLTDYSQSMYHYFQGSTHTTPAYLQEDMVDLGENTRPFFKGSASSGELIVTANSIMENKPSGTAYHFILNAEGLRLTEADYLNLSSLNLIDLQYQEYVDTDNRTSLFISGVEVINSTSVRKLLWSPFPEVQNLQEVSVPEVQLRGNDHMEFFRHQGENYMLLARHTGELIRYKLIYGPGPKLELLDRNYLGFSDNPAHRNLKVHPVYTENDKIDLYTVDQRGILSHTPDFIRSSGSNNLLLQWQENVLSTTRLGSNTWITSIPAAFGEKADLILGNASGGLIHLEDISVDLIPPYTRDPQIKIYPNPTLGPMSIISSQPGEISLYNMLGQEIMQNIPIQENIPLEIDFYLPSGVYLVQLISTSGRTITKKAIINKR